MTKKIVTEKQSLKNINNSICDNKKLGVVNCKITRNKTIFTSHKNTNKKWILIDATNVVCGRLAAYIVNRLSGKHLSSYTPNTDDGDNVVVINCDKIKFSGNKETQKLYRDHSNYVGNIRIRTAKEVRCGKRPTDLLRIAVSRMLGRCKMNYKLVSKNLHLFAGENHKHQSQCPVLIEFAKLNKKNVIE